MSRKQRRASERAERSSGGPGPSPLALMAEDARQKHERGKSERAARVIAKALAMHATDGDGFSAVAKVALAMDRLDDARRLARKAVTGIRTAASERIIGEVLHAGGELDAAIAAFQAALRLEPDHGRTHARLALVLFDQGQWVAAEDAYRLAIRCSPALAEAHCNLGSTLVAQGRTDEAIASFERALECRSDYIDAHMNLGQSLRTLGRPDQASKIFARVIELAPDDVEAHVALGDSHRAASRLGEAVLSFAQALALRPDDTRLRDALVEAFVAAGYDHITKGHAATAEKCFRQALEHSARHAAAVAGLAQSYSEQGRLDDAVETFKTSLDLNGGDAVVWSNYGNTLVKQGEVARGLEAYETSLGLAPGFPDVYSNILFVSHYASAIDDGAIFDVALRFGRTFAKPISGTRHAVEPNKRLRIGYLSGDFKYHPVGFFLNRVLASHNKSDVEVFCYPTGRADDAMTASLRESADAWHDLFGVDDDDAARMIADHGIDILVDLAGHTGGNRLLVFARRPAPVQVTWLGYFATTGLDAIDYVLLDELSAPPGSEAFFREAVVRLPYGRFCLDPPPAPEPSAPPCLETGYVTFGSFNNPAKLGALVLETWARILASVPGSRLLLKYFALTEMTARRRLQEAFAAHDIGPDRLMFEGPSSYFELLDTYRMIDIALDPFPFNGGMTSCDALWMGVPVLTLPGSNPVSRQTLGYLHRLDLQDLVASSLDDYVHRAIMLAGDRDRLARLRRTLRPRMAASPLCNGPLFVEGVEAAFREMWRRRCEAQPAKGFAISRAAPQEEGSRGAA